MEEVGYLAARLPVDLKRRLKAKLARDGITAEQWINEQVKAYVIRKSPTKRPATKQEEAA